MKPYFAKYLPVEGEIKEGEPAFYGNNLWIHQKELKVDEAKPAKLFLCSRDIRVGDKDVHTPNGLTINVPIPKDEIGIKMLQEALSGNCYKVIGEISPDATWVKEGDEFLGPEAGEECEVFPLHKHDAVIEEMIFVDKCGEQVETPIYLIKGPCGHFH